jgi:TonB-linked SusC/RagA family outer membrane protein
MKKTWFLTDYRYLFAWVDRFFKIMRISIFLIAFASLQTFALSNYAQSKKIDMKIEKSSIVKVLEKIEDETEFFFFYNNQVVNLEKQVSIDVKGRTIDQLLGEVFKDTNVEYTINNRQIILSLNGAPTIQQQKTVSGKVTDSSGASLPGASVVVKGTTTGVITDMDGKYSLSNVPANATLQFSFVGMKTQEIPVGSKTTINVTLIEEAIGLEEVVAVGYGVAKKSSITGSISTVRSEDLPNTASTSVSHMLSGKASGVTVRQTSAQPGGGVEITIRGAGSVNAGNEPLYVIDGFPVNNNTLEPGSGDRYSMGSRNPLNSINPNDIESIEILKDASSTAIYGARAANGVIMITTKRGKEGKTNVEFTANHTIQNISKYFEMLDATGFMQMSNTLGKEYYQISNNLIPYGPKDAKLVDLYVPKYTEEQIANAGTGTNWWDEVTRPGKVSEYNLSMSGGNPSTKYLVSANYFNQEGVVQNSDFSRFSGRVNLDQNISKMVKAGLSLTGSFIDNGNTQLGSGQWENSGVLMSALVMSPLTTVYNAYGKYNINPLNATMPNPVSYKEIDDHTISKRLLANSYIEINPIKDLTAKINVGIDDKSAQRNNYMPKTFLYGSQSQGKANIALNNSTDLLFNTTLNYKKTFANLHHTNFLFGYEYQKFNGNGVGVTNNKFFTDVFGSNNLGAGEGIPSTYSYKNSGKLASYFTRISYDYKEKYILNVTLRRDGTSNFGADNKWGMFPSLAVAWRITEEDFVKKFDKLSNLKLRLSYGQTGNSGIGDRAFEYYAPIGNYLFGNTIQTAVGKSQLGNSNLKWETTTEFNLGLDFGLFNNRISGTFEYYNKVVDDLLAYRTLPSYSDLSSVADNIGATQLDGFEFNLNTRNIDKELKWTTSFNISTYNNQWKKRNPNVILNPYQNEHDPIRAIYGYKTAGIKQIGQVIPHMPNALPGNLIYQDLNGYDGNNKLTGKPDGKINSADNVLIGSWDPGLTFGIGNTFEYKNFDLNFFFYGMADYTIGNPNLFKFMLDAWRLPQTENNMMKDVSQLYRSDAPSTKYPGMAVNPYQGNSDFYLEKADFIRLKNVTLGYSLPKKLINKILDLRVYFDAQNLLTITNYSGVDPETDSQGSYPNAKSYSFGVNVKF